MATRNLLRALSRYARIPHADTGTGRFALALVAENDENAFRGGWLGGRPQLLSGRGCSVHR